MGEEKKRVKTIKRERGKQKVDKEMKSDGRGKIKRGKGNYKEKWEIKNEKDKEKMKTTDWKNGRDFLKRAEKGKWKGEIDRKLNPKRKSGEKG